MGVSPLQKSRSFLILLATLALLLTSGPSAALGAPDSSAAGDHAQSAKFTTSGTYIVRMSGDPAVAYQGGINGLTATAPQAGAKINPNAADVVKYTTYLKGNHDAALKAVGATQKLYDYTFSYDGFAARLTAAQANALAARTDVVSVDRDAFHAVDTSSTPTFLGLDAEGGLWDQLGGVGSAGEGVVIGVVDSGIWPESLSFADRLDANGVPSSAPGAKRAFQQIPGWHGKCVNGEQFVATLCNQKLIGAQFFNAGWADPENGLSGSQVLNRDRPWEFLSARDYNGHGTHTSSTAGGNHGVPATGAAALFGSISGMAPRARVAMYKALWSTEDASTAGGNTTDLVAAIDQAVADGVDVINYSISGTSTNFLDAVEVSFLFAAQAGIFVAESAGNSGPTVSTVAHPGPWTTTVAAGTHNRSGKGSVTLGNGSTYEGASLTPGVGPAPIINATAAGLPGADPNLLRQCFSAGAAGALTTSGDPAPQLDPALVAGKIVVCERGGAAPANARVDKSLAVQEAGGVAMVLWNVAVSSLNADLHSVPTVHINNVDGAAVAAYAATAGATATIAQAVVVLNAAAPFTASFSSRGPLLAGGGDLLKPDVIAPGHPRRGGASGQRRQGLQHLQRHVDVEPARGRPRGPAHGPPSELVADGDQVGPDDLRHGRPRRREHESARHLPPGRRPRSPELGGRSGPRVRRRVRRLARLPPKPEALHVLLRRRARAGVRHERLQRGQHRHRRHGRPPDRDPQGHQRRRHGGDVHREPDRPDRREFRDQPDQPAPRSRPDGNLHRGLHSDLGGGERLRRRPAQLDRRQPHRSDPSRRPAGGTRRAGAGLRHRWPDQLRRAVRLRRSVLGGSARADRRDD
jgi:hypothetical protein